MSNCQCIAKILIRRTFAMRIFVYSTVSSRRKLGQASAASPYESRRRSDDGDDGSIDQRKNSWSVLKAVGREGKAHLQITAHKHHRRRPTAVVGVGRRHVCMPYARRTWREIQRRPYGSEGWIPSGRAHRLPMACMQWPSMDPGWPAAGCSEIV
jgi:hypothetical protein